MEYLKRKFWKDIGGEIGWRLKRNSWFVQYLQEIGQKDRAIAWNECIITLHVFALNDLSLRPVKIVWTISSMIKKKRKKKKETVPFRWKINGSDLEIWCTQPFMQILYCRDKFLLFRYLLWNEHVQHFFFLFASLKEGVLVRNKDK